MLAVPFTEASSRRGKTNQLKVKDTSWHFFAVLALARTDEEAQTFRNMIKKTIGNAEYKTILVIDALSSPLGLELFEEYVSYSAMSMYYNGNNNQQSKDNARKAREVLDRTWRDLYDCFYTPPELAATKREIEECHRALIEALGKPERRLVLKIINAKDHISEDTSLDSFISGFRLAWRLSAELNHYDDERPARCQAAEKPGARFTLKKEDDEQ